MSNYKYQKAYEKTPAGRASRVKYRSSNKYKKAAKARYDANPEKMREQAASAGVKVKIEVLAHYSKGRIPKCTCCGETGLLFLGIDHINNDGALHRRTIFKGNRCRGGVRMYRWLRRNGFPKGYQTSCHNCNLARHWNKGVCPHKDKKNVPKRA